MTDNEYALSIDAFTPDTIPMARLAQYMAALAEMVGSKDATHFDRIEEGSARLVSRVETRDLPKVERRLATLNGSTPENGLAKAFKQIDDLLAEDNAVGSITGPRGVVVTFPGRERPRPLAFPAFRQDGSIDGQVISIGGKDKTAHVILRDGPMIYSNIELGHELAREIAKHLYGTKIRLFGRGRWERHPDGAWKLLGFNVDRHEVLDDAPLSQVLADIRSAPENGLMAAEGAYDQMMSLRLGEDDLH